ncbi:MAG: hypothetical protein V3U62_10800 [Sedimenticolaceae bacterium]
MLAEEKVGRDVLWLMVQLSNDEPDAEISEFVDQRKRLIGSPHYVPGVYPNAPRIKLSKYTPAGFGRYIFYVSSAFGEPPELVQYHLENFIAEDNEEYVLTHQYFMLILAEQAGLELSADMIERKDELWENVYREQVQVKGVDCIDLYLERMMLILCYGERNRVERGKVEEWIQTAVDLQLSDGSWPLSKTTIHYQDSFAYSSFPRSHTTALGMLALNAYFNFEW